MGRLALTGAVLFLLAGSGATQPAAPDSVWAQEDSLYWEPVAGAVEYHVQLYTSAIDASGVIFWVWVPWGTYACCAAARVITEPPILLEHLAVAAVDADGREGPRKRFAPDVATTARRRSWGEIKDIEPLP